MHNRLDCEQKGKNSLMNSILSATLFCLRTDSAKQKEHLLIALAHFLFLFLFLFIYIYIYIYIYPTPSQPMVGKILFSDILSTEFMKFKIQNRAQCKIMIKEITDQIIIYIYIYMYVRMYISIYVCMYMFVWLFVWVLWHINYRRLLNPFLYKRTVLFQTIQFSKSTQFNC